MTTTITNPTPKSDERKSREARRRFAGSSITTVTWLVAFIFFAPVIWLVMTAFKPESATASNPPVFFFVPTFEQFQAVLAGGAGSYFLNSLIATGVSTVLVILLAVPAAYAVSIRPVKKTQDVLFFFISTKMLPVVAVIMPIYVIAGQLKVLDNIGTLIVLYTAMNLPIAVWMMRSFFQEVPAEVLEAAAMDGAGLIKTMRTILMPMVTPGLAATALICVIFAWNEFFFALVLIQSPENYTLPVTLKMFVGGEGKVALGPLAAGAVMAAIPSLIFFGFMQRKLAGGLLAGAVKG